jgi:hypothetical protein
VPQRPDFPDSALQINYLAKNGVQVGFDVSSSPGSSQSKAWSAGKTAWLPSLK